MIESTQNLGGFSLARFFWKKLYWILIIIFIIPVIIFSISYAIKTENPSYPFIKLGILLTNSDRLLSNQIKTLNENPTSLIEIRPETGLLKLIKYYFKLSLFVWDIMGLILFISLPFTLFYYYFRYKNPMSKLKNIGKSFIAGFIFLFIINVILTSYEIMTNQIILNSKGEMYKDIYEIIKINIPFNGLFSLFIYLFKLFM